MSSQADIIATLMTIGFFYLAIGLVLSAHIVIKVYGNVRSTLTWGHVITLVSFLPGFVLAIVTLVFLWAVEGMCEFIDLDFWSRPVFNGRKNVHKD